MKKLSLIVIACFLIGTSLIAQDLKPQKDKESKKYGFVNKTGEWIVKAIYDNADKFKDGLAKIYIGKKEGLITETGAVLLEPQFDDIEKFRDGVAIVKNNKKYGLIDKDGKTLCEPKYDNFENFAADKSAIIKMGKKQGVILTSGEVICEPKYDEITPFKNNLSNIKLKDTWGLMDFSGKVIFEPIYARALVFNSKDLAVAFLYVGDPVSAHYGILKRDGSIVMPCEQGRIEIEKNRFIVEKNDGKSIILDDSANPITKEFDGFKSFSASALGGYKYIIDGLIAAKQGSKWGFVNEVGATVIPFNYDEVGCEGYAFSNGFCAVKIGEKWGFINKKGEILNKVEFDDVKRFVTLASITSAFVMKDGKEYILNSTGELKLSPKEMDNSRPVSTAPTATATAAAAAPTSTNTAQTATSTAQVPENNDWIIGTWKVTEEKMGGSPKTGNNTNYVSYTFSAGGSGNYIERYDVMANKTTTNNITWSLSGNQLKIKSANYTVNPGADKRTMTLNGPLGTSWKLTK